MPRYKLLIEYDGTAYSGWQKQPNVTTIEEVLESALSRVLQEKVNMIGQGRTDSGVHAEAQVAHIDVSKCINTDDLLYALLGVLPRDISVWEIQLVTDTFHARFDAKWRQYRYHVVTRPRPLLHHVAALVRYDLDWEAMKSCAGMIEGTHDFTCFSKANRDQPDANCAVEFSSLEQHDSEIIYRIRANRFVHHMVRRLMGSMLKVGKERWSVDHFRDLLMQPDDERKGHGAPAKGLILEKVEYRN